MAGDGLCSGDSGGSAFDQESFTRGRPVTFGVLSRAGETGLKCVDAVFTRTDAFSDLLVGAAKEAAEAGGYPLPAWAGGGTGEGGADAGADAGSPAAPPAGGEAPAATGCAAGSTGPGPGYAVVLGLAGLACLVVGRRRARHPPAG